MKALASPYLDLFPCNQRLPLSSSRGVALPSPASIANQRRPRYAFRFSVSFLSKSIPAISASVSASAQTNAESEGLQTINPEPTKTVHIKFKLLKECAFGQQFLIVGDDPVMGAWDPSGGVPLTWSEGHLWTAEVDLPIDKLFKYKFILENVTGGITWQPGPDRILKTWNTDKMISVFEDWYNPELRNIVEEELTTDLTKEAVISSNLLIPTEQPTATFELGSGAIKADGNANGVAIPEEKPFVPMVAENMTEKLGKQAPTSNEVLLTPMTLEAITTGPTLFSSEDGTRLLSNEEVPVLVPGLGTMPQEVIAEPELAQVENSILDNAATDPAPDEISVLAEPKLTEDYASASAPLHSTESDEKQQPYDKEQLESNDAITDEKQQPYDKEQPETDMQWGKRTFLKLLSSFGFQ